jgi:hypothetical protein
MWEVNDITPMEGDNGQGRRVKSRKIIEGLEIAMFDQESKTLNQESKTLN